MIPAELESSIVAAQEKVQIRITKPDYSFAFLANSSDQTQV